MIHLWKAALFLCLKFAAASSNHRSNQINSSFFDEFKITMMYFNDALLSNAKLRGYHVSNHESSNFEGAPILSVALKLVEHARSLSEMSDYIKYLNYGISIMEKIPYNFGEVMLWLDFFHNALNNVERIILPIVWMGKAPHAINIIIEKIIIDNTGNNFYNLVVVNSGDGLQYHTSRADPKEIYPQLKRLWIEFVDIPESELFDAKDPWFFKLLIHLSDSDVVENVEETSGPIVDYFYSSLLYNFKKYVKSPQEYDNHKLYHDQKSGSCALSSLMASYLFVAQDEVTFYRNKVILGQKILEEFLDKYGKNTDFIKLITDGFDLISRNLIKATSSALAYQILAYLEVKYSEFENSSLLGKGLADWLGEKKLNAMEILENDVEMIDLMRKGVDLSLRIQKILNSNPIRKESNLIEIDPFVKIIPGPSTPGSFNILSPENIAPNIVFNGFNALPSRIKRKFSSFESFFGALKKCNNDKKFTNRICMLDIFERMDWWLYLDQHVRHSLEFLEFCKKATLNFLNSTDKPTSMDDIVLLAHLQIGTWKSAVIYDQYMAPIRLNLKRYAPPIDLLKFIYRAEKRFLTFTDGGFNNWRVYQPFYISDAVKLNRLLDVCEGFFVGKMRLFDGDYILSSNILKIDPSILFMMKSAPLFTVFNEMLKDQAVKEIVETIRKENEKVDFNWSKSNYADQHILLTRSDKLEQFFPHFYHYLSQVIWSFHSVLIRPVQCNGPIQHAFNSDFNSDIKQLILSCSSIWKENLFQLHESNEMLLENIPSTSALKTGKTTELTFYRLRHSEAFLTVDFDEVNFETWFNYIRGAVDPTIFDSNYFLHLSDKILNIPALKYGKSFFQFFDLSNGKITSVIDEFMRLISLDLNYLIDYRDVISAIERDRLVKRAAEIAGILIRFINRIELFFPSMGSITSSYFAKLYQEFYQFSHFNNNNGLLDSEVSRINLILAYICNAPFQDRNNFLNTINSNLFKDFKRSKMSRQILKRIPWFLAQSNYIQSESLYSKVDHIYDVGFVFIPIEKNEITFTNYLIHNLFLPKFDADRTDWESVRYHRNGDLVLCSTNSGVNTQKVIFQLSSGLIVQNGDLVVNKQIIFNQKEFKSFFPSEDWELSMRGELSKIGETIVYVVEDYKYKGNNIVFLYDRVFNYCHTFRKIDDEWYRWLSDPNSFQSSYSYKWTIGSKVYAKVESIRKRSNDFYSCDAVLLSNDTNQKTILKIYYNSNEQINRVQFNINGITKIWTLKCFVGDHSFLEKHLKTFTNSDTILAFDDEDNRKLAVIYPGLRLKEDPHYPLILSESKNVEGNSEFQILNSPNLVVISNQIAAKDIGIKGTLVVRNGEGLHFLMLPLHGKIEAQERSKPHEIEMIPMLNNFPAPENRLQRLLFAYYCMRMNATELARSFLKPFISIHQNEVFSKKELEIMSWMMVISKKEPENNALKLFVYMHIQINMSKFPLGYISYEKDLLKRTSQDVIQIFFEHMRSIREIPEKFIVFNVFPEILQKQYYSKIFYSLRSHENNENWELKDFELSCSQFSSCNLLSPDKQIGLINAGTVENVFNKLATLFDFTVLSDYLKSIQRVIYRKSIRTNEAILSCMSTDLMGWKEVATSIINYCSPPIRKPNDFKLIVDNIMKKLNTCMETCKEDFAPYDLAKSSTFTSPENIFSTISAALTRQHDEKKFRIKPIVFVNDSDKRAFAELELKIATKFPKKSLAAETFTSFDERLLQKSRILKRLQNSIADFGQNSEFFEAKEIETSALSESLNSFVDYLTVRIHDLRSKFIIQLLNLSIQTGTDEKVLNSVARKYELITRLMHRKKMKKFEHLYKCYQKLSPECIQAKFPQLNSDQSEALLQLTFEFYSNQVLQDYFEFLLDICKKWLQMVTIQMDQITLFLDELSKIIDFDSRLEMPTILNLEYRSKKYRLRKEQFNDIQLLSEFKEGTESFRSVVIQRMMAAGKTLIIGTISVVQKALRRGKLSILVPPSSLYQSNLSEMQTRGHHYFKSKGHNFAFPRFSFSTNDEIKENITPYLENLKGTLVQGMRDGNYFILNPDSLQSFLNSYIEMINFEASHWGVDSSTALSLYADIYLMFKTDGSIILDEIDMTLDPKKELNYPTKLFEHFNMTAVVLIVDLIEFSIFDEGVQAIGLNIRENNQASLSEDNFRQYRNCLLNYISAQLGNDESLWNVKILKDASMEQEEVVDFLRTEDISYNPTLIESLYTLKKKEVADALLIVKQQLLEGLKASMKASANLNYGASGSNRNEILYAVPYIAANTPSSKSEFSDRWETLNKTLLMLASVPCSEIIVVNLIKFVRRKAIIEAGTTGKISETSTGETFSSLAICIDILDLNEADSSHVELIKMALKERSPAAIRLLFTFAIEEIFSAIEFPIEQITCNALNMASMFNSVQGYSGTIENINILPQEVIVDAYNDHLKNEVNNGGVARKLIEDSGGKMVQIINDEVFINGSLIEMITSMMAGNEESSKLSALIDVGAFFKNFKNRQVAEAFLEVLKERIDAVLYYDENLNQVEFVRKIRSEGSYTYGYIPSTEPETILKATQVELNRRFTFYDQRHITGSDILQPIGARALMTVGSRVLLRDILQGSLRLRQFMTSQMIYLLTSDLTIKFYQSMAGIESDRIIKVADMLTLGAMNEDEKQMNENVKLAFMKINNEVRSLVTDEISRAIKTSKKPEKIISIFFNKDRNDRNLQIRDLFIRFLEEEPISWMSELHQRDSSLVLREYVSYWLQKLENCYEEISKIDPEFNASAVEKLKESLKGKLANMTASSDPLNMKVDSLLAFLDEHIVYKKHALFEGGEVELQAENHGIIDFDIEKLNQKSHSYTTSPGKKFAGSLERLVSTTETEYIKSGSMSEIDFFSLKSVLDESNIAEYIQDLKDSLIITSGENVHVSNDLVELVEDLPRWPLKIFSNATWEGSHILLQVFPKNYGMRLILGSRDFAKEVFHRMKTPNFDFKGSNLWLCNLAGDIIQTSDLETRIGSNILDTFPDSKDLLFDALIFNGSLDQILSSEVLKSIYYGKWLNELNYQCRSKFLLLRLHFLSDKDKYTFSLKNEHINALKKAALGQRPSPKISVSSTRSQIYPKPPVISSKSNECTPRIYEDYHETLKRPKDLSKLLEGINETRMIKTVENPFDFDNLLGQFKDYAKKNGSLKADPEHEHVSETSIKESKAPGIDESSISLSENSENPKILIL